MKVIVTCGPSFEPIDEVRRLTNFSTGELGVRLSEALGAAGFDVLCFKGSGATHRDPAAPVDTKLFGTNDDLLRLLEGAAGQEDVGAVFHVAALCDYKIKHVADESGARCDSPKIASRSGALTLTLEPATKVITRMRGLFPGSLLVGWKYELAGTIDDVLAKARRQLSESRSDACVVNGRAYGRGFGFLRQSGEITECPDKETLVQFLSAWLRPALEARAKPV
jgi:phosphopantothenoylcysteine synthetase/decarboxylase